MEYDASFVETIKMSGLTRFSVKDFLSIFSMSDKTLRELIKNKQIEYSRLQNKDIVFSLKNVLDFCQRNIADSDNSL